MSFTWLSTPKSLLVVTLAVSFCTDAREYLVADIDYWLSPHKSQKDFSTLDEIPDDATSVFVDRFSWKSPPSFGFSHLFQSESLTFYGFAETIEKHAWFGLSRLKELTILQSHLRVLNEESFQHLASLKKLFLTNSRISTIGSGVWSELTSLNELHLESATINYLEKNTFLGLSTLQKLSLHRNEISEIKDYVCNSLLSVRHIDLNQNRLTRINKNMWRGVDSLTHLNLAFNSIVTMEIGAWMYLRNLIFLDLSHNALNALYPVMFDSLRLLKELEVSFNNISTVDEDAFSGLKKIQTIWLAKNVLTTLLYNSFNSNDFKTTGGHPEKLTLYLYSNDFYCDDKLNWMKVGEIRGWLRVLPISCANFPGIDWEDITLPDPSNPRDECEDGTHFCSDDSKCSDTLESYSCTCKSGFTGDGYTCNIIKECDDECSEHAYCDKIEEHFQCKCNPGFIGDGKTCSNLNECSEPQNVCSEFAKCTDNLGSFHCFCRVGYEGNGFSCNTSVSCPSGSYLENGINCTLCPLNSYSNRDNNVLSNCIQCPPNYVTGVVGSTSVSQCFLPTSCSSGHFTNETSGECSQCENSTYQPRASQTSCRVCPGNKLETGGPGAVLISNCVIKQTKQVLFKLRLLTEGYDILLKDQTSDVFMTQSNAIRNTLTTALNGTRYFLDVYVESFSPGSILVDMAATLVNHPDAESVFFARLDSLLDSLFPGGALLQGTPDIEVFSVTDLEPSFGPQSGGTLVTLHGINLQLHGVFNVEIGTLRCPLILFEDDKVVCETPSLSNEEILNEPQAVKVSWLNTEIPDEKTRYNFTYKADPEIKDIEPKLTITGGGIQITVTGENMDSVAEPIMVVVVVNLLTGDPSIFFQACEVKSSTEFVCPTPDLSDVITDDNYTKQVESGYCEIPIKYHDVHDTYQRSAGTSKADIKVNVQFLMDGVKNDKEEEKIFDIKVQSNPVFEKEEKKSYIPHPPCNDDYIEIKGQNFLQGLTPDVYTVKVGNEACTELSVTNNLITCRPPKSKPEAHSEVQVIIGTGCFIYYAFTLDYGGPFDCKAVPYITAASLFIVMLLAVVITVFYKHRRRRLLNNRLKKRDPGPFHITHPIPQRGSPIRSWYPLMPYPTYPSYLDLVQSASLGHNAYLYPYHANNDYQPQAYLTRSSSKAIHKPSLSQQQLQQQQQRQFRQRPLVPHPYDNAYAKR